MTRAEWLGAIQKLTHERVVHDHDAIGPRAQIVIGEVAALDDRHSDG